MGQGFLEAVSVYKRKLGPRSLKHGRTALPIASFDDFQQAVDQHGMAGVCVKNMF